jgi:hypothetical protein
VHQIGLNDLEQDEVSCLMKFFGKPTLDDAVLYDEVKQVMCNYGVALTTPKTSPQAQKEEAKEMKE